MDSNPEFPTPELVAPAAELGNTRPIEASYEDSPWNAVDLVIGACAFLATLFVSTSFLVSVAAHTTGTPYGELVKNPGALIVVPAMILGYIALISTWYFRLRSTQSSGFWDVISWRWPSGSKSLAFLVIGVLMAVVLPFLSHLLPSPKSIPLDRFFRDERAAYLMMFMGVAVAPFAEELTFRGFLYPVLDRWFQTSLTARRRLLNGVSWLLVIVAWGYVVHRVAQAQSLGPGPASALSTLLAIFVLVPISFWSLGRWLKGKPASPVLIPGLALCSYGLLSRAVSARSFSAGATALGTLAVVVAVIAIAGPFSRGLAHPLGRTLAVLVTSSSFALVHGEQLGGAWVPLLMIFSVGLVLTVTRVLTRSVAPGFLIHVGYNFALFCTVYFGTDHFRHLERLSQ